MATLSSAYGYSGIFVLVLTLAIAVAIITVFVIVIVKYVNTTPESITETLTFTVNMQNTGLNYQFGITASNIIIDWGDGSDTQTSSTGGTLNHTYSTADNYTVTITADNITSLNVSGSGSNDRITDMDLSQCTQLQTLDCSLNDLTVLDVSKCGSLVTLICDGVPSDTNSNLVKIDATNCTLLKTLSAVFSGNLDNNVLIAQSKLLNNFNLSNCGLTSDEVTGYLKTLNDFNTRNGKIYLAGDNQAPTQEGYSIKDQLLSREWQVYTN